MDRIFIALLTAPLLACGVTESLHLEDDLGADDSDVDIHRPYARGSVVTMSVDGWRHGRIDDTWDIVPDDPTILVVQLDEDEPEDDEDDDLSVEFIAESEGTTSVSLLDDEGEVRARATVEVVMPDTITLHVATAERMEMPELESADCGVRIVEGGTGGLVAQYWLGDTEVFGNEVLSLVSNDPVVADVDHSYSGKNLDWLQLTPEGTGTQTVDLLVDGVHLHSLEYEAVAAEAVATSAFLGADETDAREGDWLELLIQAFDAEDCPLYGARWNWDVDGELQEDQGDLFRYEFDESITTELTATFGDEVRTTTVHGEGSVANSNDAGCSAAAGSAALAPALLGLLALARRRDD